MPNVGPFFMFRCKILADIMPLQSAEKYGDKLTSPTSHSALFDRIIKHGEYMLIPRGRVVWDTVKSESIVYVDKCLNDPFVIEEICRVFDLTDFHVEHDEHYVCPKCKPRSFTHLM